MEPTCPQADPRTDPKVTFMDLVEEEAETPEKSPQSIEEKNTTEEAKLEEILDFLLSTEKEAQSVKSTKIYSLTEKENTIGEIY